MGQNSENGARRVCVCVCVRVCVCVCMTVFDGEFDVFDDSCLMIVFDEFDDFNDNVFDVFDDSARRVLTVRDGCDCMAVIDDCL